MVLVNDGGNDVHVKLKHRISSILLDGKGVLFSPFRKRDGSLIWPSFAGPNGHHMLIVHQPSLRSKAEQFIGSLRFCDDVCRVDIMDAGEDPATGRRRLHKIAGMLDGTPVGLHRPRMKAVRRGVVVSSVDRETAMVIVVHGVTGLLENVRRQKTRMGVLDDLRRLMDDGPDRNIHVVLMQEASDDGAVILSELGRRAGNTVCIGYLNPITLQIVFGSMVSWSGAKPRSTNIAWVRCASDVWGHMVSGLVPIP